MSSGDFQQTINCGKPLWMRLVLTALASYDNTPQLPKILELLLQHGARCSLDLYWHVQIRHDAEAAEIIGHHLLNQRGAAKLRVDWYKQLNDNRVEVWYSTYNTTATLASFTFTKQPSYHESTLKPHLLHSRQPLDLMRPLKFIHQHTNPLWNRCLPFLNIVVVHNPIGRRAYSSILPLRILATNQYMPNNQHIQWANAN